jgi:hypothetical protein
VMLLVSDGGSFAHPPHRPSAGDANQLRSEITAYPLP